MPIVALTADAFQESRDRARQAGMDGFLTKPAHLPQLRDALVRFGGIGSVPVPASPASAGTTTPAEPNRLDQATIDDVRRSLSPEQYAALLERFFDDCANTLDELRNTAAAATAAELRAHAHSLKGAALSLGLRSVAAVAEQVERSSDDLAPVECARLLAALEQESSLTRAQCVRAGVLPQ